MTFVDMNLAFALDTRQCPFCNEELFSCETALLCLDCGWNHQFEKFLYPEKAIVMAKEKFYSPKNLAKGNSWQTLSIEFLNDKLIEEFEEWAACEGCPSELLDIINVAAMLYIRKTE